MTVYVQNLNSRDLKKVLASSVQNINLKIRLLTTRKIPLDGSSKNPESILKNHLEISFFIKLNNPCLTQTREITRVQNTIYVDSKIDYPL